MSSSLLSNLLLPLLKCAIFILVALMLPFKMWEFLLLVHCKVAEKVLFCVMIIKAMHKKMIFKFLLNLNESLDEVLERSL